MNDSKTTKALALILVLAAISLYLVLPIHHPTWVTNLLFWQPEGARSLDFRQGLDLQGGLQVLLVADVPPDEKIDPGALEAAAKVVESRVNALGLLEPVVQVRGERRIIVELPGIDNPEQAIDTIRETALLEFVEPPPGTPTEMLQPGTVISTTYGMTATTVPSGTLLFKTILTGKDLKRADSVFVQQSNEWVIDFELQPEAKDLFADYTASHINQPLCIVLDKTILSCPYIRSKIPDGRGQISGDFTKERADQLAIQLKYGALPIPLKIESYRAIGPSLGAESVQKSIRAGIIGLAIVFLFMVVYYRLNGVAADLALALYVVLNLLVYKLLPVTITLPGIAGFLLSAGMAVDANILVFERMKEELRRGRSLQSAMEAGFSRAWTSVRDSNYATLLTCLILYFFGSAFAASLVKGFAITLALGTIINLFTAIFVTRTFVRVIIGLYGDKIQQKPELLGL